MEKKSRKRYVIKPTILQKRAAHLMADAISNRPERGFSRKKVLMEAGYSELMAGQASKILESKGYKEYFNELISEEKMRKKHDELLENENPMVQIKALDMAYRVSGGYAPVKQQSATLNIDVDVSNNPDSQKLVDEYEEKLKKMLEK